MQLELYFKNEYVCEIPSRRLKHFRHILRKDIELADLLHQVTYEWVSLVYAFLEGGGKKEEKRKKKETKVF